MAPQVSSSIISEKNKCNISTPIDLLGNNMKDLSFIKFGSFHFEVKQNIMKDRVLLHSCFPCEIYIIHSTCITKIDYCESRPLF